MESWIKLYRKFKEWEWYHNSEMVHLFMHLLLTVNNKDAKWMGQDIKRGQLVTGRLALSKATGISEQSIRTCLKRLKSTNEITIKSTKHYSIITICKYESYQLINNKSNQQINHKTNQQLTNNQPTTNHKQDNIDNKELKNIYPFVKDEFLKTFSRWIDYKTARKQTYKTDDSLQACYNKLVNFSKNNPITAASIIETAIGNNYAGFFELKSIYNRNNGNSVPTAIPVMETNPSNE